MRFKTCILILFSEELKSLKKSDFNHLMHYAEKSYAIYSNFQQFFLGYAISF